MFIAITIIIGTIGGLTAVRLKLPAGAIIGSLISVALFSIFTGKAEFPQSFKLVTQIGTGAYIGAQICNKDVAEIKSIIKPAIILSIFMCLFGIFAGTLLSIVSDIDLTTALFATAPAGIADMTLISVDFGADSSKVAAVQLVRLVSVIAIMPNLIKYYLKKSNKAQIEDKPPEKYEESCADYNEIFKRTLITMAVGFAFGFIGYISGFPAGSISFSMIACAVYNIRTSRAYMPINLRKSIQFLGGALIGARITMEQVMGMRGLLPAMIIIIAGYILLTFVLGFLLIKFSTLDVTTAMYSSTAGGLTDMAIIAGEMGADAPKVAVLQFARVVSIIAFYPVVIKLLLHILT